MQEPTYDKERERRLVELLRGLAARIAELASDEELLAQGPELLRMMGDARSELFHYEVRSTYDTPDVAESRRIVDQARRQREQPDLGGTRPDFDDEEDDQPWQGR